MGSITSKLVICMGIEMEKWQRIKYQPGTPIGEEGQRVTACKAHRELSLRAAKEGMVLLKNERRLLPLAKGTKLALFGKGSIDYVKGGGGSGDVTVEYTKNLYDGLKELKDYVQIFEPLSDFYRKNIKHQYGGGKLPGMTVEPQVSEELYQSARAYTDTAIISICRFSGEGWDRKSQYDDKKELSADPLLKTAQEIFERGDFYLTKGEEAMVEKVKELFDNIVVVLNVGGMVDTQWFARENKISSVLMAWQGGMEGGRAAAQLLCGLGNPCGKLSDTFAKSLEVYPSSPNFHESEDYVDYTEDIYVGYRYFETIPKAKEQVNYPFGYGKSYTKFQWNVDNAECRGTLGDAACRLYVKVTNIGTYAGKEVMQLYVKAPQGALGKPARVLAAFSKTRLLQPGESQLLTLEYNFKDIASYDDLGKLYPSAYVLEEGEYQIYVGNSVASATLVFSFTMEKNVLVKQLRPKLVPTSLSKRMLSDGSYEELPLAEPNDPNASLIERKPPESLDGLTPTGKAVNSVCLWKYPYKEGVRPLIDVAQGKISLDEFVNQMTDEEAAFLLGGQPNTGVANTFGMGNMPEYGIPNVMTADGPAGLRIAPECGVCTTAWPCSTLLACTWDEDLVFQVGEAGAKEVKENNIGMWLTPAINIHRSPMCGRNFEYYSEDPYLTGKLAGAMVRGIQSQHISAAVKHFAFNNKETNRKNSDSRVSERAAREIYLKAFEIIVREAKPWCIMSSYNIVNGYRTSENRELLWDILREEWGYDGMVTSDWWTFGEHYKEVKAGNDLKMALGFPDSLLKALEAGALTREEMNVCVKRILQLILKMD